jgi:hypothetical protein
VQVANNGLRNNEKMSWPPPNYHPERGTGYQVTFDDFRRLISGPDSRQIMAPLLEAWFSYRIAGKAGTVYSSTGEPVDLRALHDEIQSDPRKQYDLYQSATDFWR